MSLARKTGEAEDKWWCWNFCRFAGVLILSLGVGLGLVVISGVRTVYTLTPRLRIVPPLFVVDLLGAVRPRISQTLETRHCKRFRCHPPTVKYHSIGYNRPGSARKDQNPCLLTKPEIFAFREYQAVQYRLLRPWSQRSQLSDLASSAESQVLSRHHSDFTL